MKMETSMKANHQQRIPKPEATTVTIGTTVTDDQIRLRAYEIYQQRNGEPGDPVQDWLQAEAELTAPELAMAQVA